jgi:hypothetical protein
MFDLGRTNNTRQVGFLVLYNTQASSVRRGREMLPDIAHEYSRGQEYHQRWTVSSYRFLIGMGADEYKRSVLSGLHLLL